VIYNIPNDTFNKFRIKWRNNMKLELWLDESGAFNDKKDGRVSSIGGLLIEKGKLTKEDVSKILEKQAKEMLVNNHLVIPNTIRDELIVTLLRTLKIKKSKFVIFENSNRVEIVNVDKTYFNIFSQGIIQLFEILVKEYGEKIDLEIIIAARAIMPREGYFSFKSTQDEDYAERLEEQIALAMAFRPEYLGKNITYKISTVSPRNEPRFAVADVISHAWYRKNNLALMNKHLGQLEHLFSSGYIINPFRPENIQEIDYDKFMIEEFIWPLSTSYRITVNGNTEPTSRLNNFFKLFENTAAFFAIVLLSSLPEEVYEENREFIWNKGHSDYRKVSLGMWVGLYVRLCKLFKELEDHNLLASVPLAKSISKAIVRKELAITLNHVTEIRNKTLGHGGILSENVAIKCIDELNIMLLDFKESFLAFKGISLIYPDSMTKNKGIYKIKVKNLEGTYYPFSEEFIETSSDLDTHTLYLYKKDTEERLRLLPELIKLVQCVECSSWSIYIYNKIERENARYLSYHMEIHSHVDKRYGVLEDL
jgi:hypothetical protein